MLTRKFENPFHTIVFDYDESRVETDYEKELVKKYLHFLNRQQKQHLLMVEYTGQFYRQQLMQDECTDALHKVMRKFAPVFEQQKTINKTKIITPEEYFNLREKFDEVFSVYLKFHEQYIEPFRECSNANDRVFQRLFNWFEGEKDSEAFSKFDDYAQELYTNYAQYSLDLVQFDQDVEAMKDDWQKLKDEWEVFFKLREKINRESRLFCDLLNTFNKKVNQLQIDLLGMDESWNALNN